MPRTLLLLRHAHAEMPGPGQADADRPLSLRGQAEAEAAGRWLAAHAPTPQRVLCSPALRTRATCEQVLEQTGYAPVQIEPRIYEATPGTLLRVLDDHPDPATLLLVGHNPGLEDLLALLSAGASGAGRGMPPCGLAWLEIPDGALEPARARVREFWFP